MPEAMLPFNPLDPGQRDERLHRFSHALKNRLGSLWQAASMLHDLPEGPERQQLLAMAEKSYFNGAAELERLMDDFAVPRGITNIRREPLDLPPLLKECIGHIAFRTERKVQEVRLSAMEKLMMQGDRGLLAQLFEALLSNASKFSPKGSLIRVSLETDAAGIRAEVKDEGAGLSSTDLANVFTRYELLSSRSTDGESQARSTLARAKQWAEVHGGSLEADSEGPGKGATFRVRLPLA